MVCPAGESAAATLDGETIDFLEQFRGLRDDLAEVAKTLNRRKRIRLQAQLRFQILNDVLRVPWLYAALRIALP